MISTKIRAYAANMPTLADLAARVEQLRADYEHTGDILRAAEAEHEAAEIALQAAQIELAKMEGYTR